MRSALVNTETVETKASQEEMPEESTDLVTVGGLFDDEPDTQEDISMLG